MAFYLWVTDCWLAVGSCGCLRVIQMRLTDAAGPPNEECVWSIESRSLSASRARQNAAGKKKRGTTFGMTPDFLLQRRVFRRPFARRVCAWRGGGCCIALVYGRGWRG